MNVVAALMCVGYKSVVSLRLNPDRMIADVKPSLPLDVNWADEKAVEHRNLRRIGFIVTQYCVLASSSHLVQAHWSVLPSKTKTVCLRWIIEWTFIEALFSSEKNNLRGVYGELAFIG